MQLDRVIDAAEVLGWLAEQVSSLPNCTDQTTVMALRLEVAHLYLADYAALLSKGLDPEAALHEAARGTLDIADG